MAVRVKNVIGTGILDGFQDENLKSKYSSFMDFWEKQQQRGNNLSGNFCANKCCNNSAAKDRNNDDEFVGAHVYIETDVCHNDIWYIVPMCKECNNSENNETKFVDKSLLVKLPEEEVEAEKLAIMINELPM